MAGRKEIARLAGVSTTTVTRVLSNSGTVSKKTRLCVEEIVKELGYTRNAIASNLSTKKRSNVIALLVPDMTNYYYMEMFDAMVSSVHKRNATISIYSTSHANINEVVSEVISNRVNGIVNLGLVPISHESYKKVCCAGIRFIYPGIRNQEKFTFKINHERSMRQAIAHLKATGCKKIGFVFGLKEKSLYDPKIQCFKQSLTLAGYKWSDDDIILGTYPRYSAISMGYEKAKEMFSGKKPYDALFCLNDMMAIGMIKGILECGLKIPEDVSIIGFDGISLDEYLDPSISSIQADIAMEGLVYVQYCMGEIDTSVIEIYSKFIPRATTRKKIDTQNI